LIATYDAINSAVPPYYITSSLTLISTITTINTITTNGVL
jgi:hypothetical protein